VAERDVRGAAKVKDMNRRRLLKVFLGASAALSAGTAAYAQNEPAISKPPEDKPFAEHFVALQLSDSDPKKERLVLSVASNLLKAYGADKVAIEVVAFGPGIDLLRETNEFRALVDSLVTQGVRFDVCGNTLDTIERETGKRPAINPKAVEVQVGVAQLIALSRAGYTVVRP
jgi:intracellular sulfur oxidation DsrE/DsrF family protein